MISVIIPTNGKRRDSLDVLIGSVIDQIPDVEIIVVGPADDLPIGCINIPADKETEDGLLSAKIHIGCQYATRHIMMFIHDDMMLHESFWAWFKFNRWYVRMACNEVDFLAPSYIYPNIVTQFMDNFYGIPQEENEPEESPLWTLGPKGHHPITISEWDDYSYVSGESLILTRNSFLKSGGWQIDNDHRKTRGTIEAYDVVFGHKCNRLGLVISFDERVALYHHKMRSNFTNGR